MPDAGSSFDSMLNAAIKVGFIIIMVGLVAVYIPMLLDAVDITAGLLGAWNRFRNVPAEIQLILTGIVFIGLAVAIGTVRELVEVLVNNLLGREKKEDD